MKKIVIILFVFAFLSCTSQTAVQDKKLMGKWVGNLINYKTGRYLGKMYLEFKPGGEFIQRMVTGKEQAISKMTYRLSKDQIFYKGKATGNEEFPLNYRFKGNVLILAAEGNSEEYVRVK